MQNSSRWVRSEGLKSPSEEESTLAVRPASFPRMNSTTIV